METRWGGQKRAGGQGPGAIWFLGRLGAAHNLSDRPPIQGLTGRTERLFCFWKAKSHMKTTLIYPGIAGYGFNSIGKGMEAGWISHGLAHLSAAAKAKGFDVDLISQRDLSAARPIAPPLAPHQPQVPEHAQMLRYGRGGYS